jgi:predicted oxidoreductase (fatty acid repression mutant protein)
MSADFLTSIKSRRSYYSINNTSPIPDEKIEQIVIDSLKYVPSAFNSQSNRVVLLFGASHNKFWDIVKETLRAIVPPEKFEPTDKKINSFAAGHGTVLYFYDTKIVEGMQQKFPMYKDNFPVWAEQSSAMFQFTIWSLLEAEGLGANLQHYNPIVDDQTKKIFNVPENYKLVAQMPFGGISGAPGEKEFDDIDKMIKILK